MPPVECPLNAPPVPMHLLRCRRVEFGTWKRFGSALTFAHEPKPPAGKISRTPSALGYERLIENLLFNREPHMGLSWKERKSTAGRIFWPVSLCSSLAEEDVWNSRRDDSVFVLRLTRSRWLYRNFLQFGRTKENTNLSECRIRSFTSM